MAYEKKLIEGNFPCQQVALKLSENAVPVQLFHRFIFSMFGGLGDH